jgi:hypothetical protein
MPIWITNCLFALYQDNAEKIDTMEKRIIDKLTEIEEE